MPFSFEIEVGNEMFITPVSVAQSDISKACNAVLEAMENTLPEEAHTYEVYNHVLKESMDAIKTKKVRFKQLF